MKIVAVCITYKRPRILEEAIECFLRQDYPASQRELLILDDAGQFDNTTGDGWQLISMPRRFNTLGEKRNAAMALAGNADAYSIWDDDDIYLPWHMSAAATALASGGDYATPTRLYIDKGACLHHKTTANMFHAAWSFTRAAFERVRGYPFIQSGQDQGLLRLFKQANLRQVDPLEFDKRPSFIYRWETAHIKHTSSAKFNFEDAGREPYEHVHSINPHLDKDWVQMHEAAAVA